MLSLLCVPALVIFLNSKARPVDPTVCFGTATASLYLGQAGFISLTVAIMESEFTGSSLRTSFLHVQIV